MEKLIDAVVTLASVIALTAGGNYALRETAQFVRKAALTKASQGLPALSPMTKRLIGNGK